MAASRSVGNGPRYQHIATALRDRIRSGEIGPGAALPTQKALSTEHGVSLEVVVQALNVLEREGLIDRAQGRGTFVRNRQRSSSLVRAHPSLPAQDDSDQGQTSQRDRSWAIEPASADVAERLGVAVGDMVSATRYLTCCDDQPVKHVVSFEPLAVSQQDPAVRPAATQVQEIVAARMSHPDERHRFDLPLGEPVTTITRTTFHGVTPIETADILLLGTAWTLSSTYKVPRRGSSSVQVLLAHSDDEAE